MWYSIFVIQIKFTQAARKHRVGNAHALFVMQTVEPTHGISAEGDPMRTWIGPDDRGLDLEVMGVETTDARSGTVILLVIHVFPTALRHKEK